MYYVIVVALALINVPFLIESDGKAWWHAITIGFCLGMGVATWINAH